LLWLQFPALEKKKGGKEIWTQVQRKNDEKTQEETATHKPTPGRHLSFRRSSPATTLTSDFSLQSCEKINICCLNYQSLVLYFGSPHKPTQLTNSRSVSPSQASPISGYFEANPGILSFS
jgi:hypothetical protein